MAPTDSVGPLALIKAALAPLSSLGLVLIANVDLSFGFLFFPFLFLFLPTQGYALASLTSTPEPANVRENSGRPT
uniref:Uncharacterized protein n=1 Tax=Daucus carota subsp. sativus TaxID=79200 RepID=A0A164TB67_DAUCS